MNQNNLPEVQIDATTQLPTRFGTFEFSVWREKEQEHILLVKGDLTQVDAPLVRIHSACLTGECFLSQKCDCKDQLHHAMELMEKEGAGVIVYLNQEGRGIGLINKIKAYALQENGLDTVEANEALHLPIDDRSYASAISALKYLDISAVRLITNNPQKIKALESAGIQVRERVTLPSHLTPLNKNYLLTKKKKLGHLIELDDDK